MKKSLFLLTIILWSCANVFAQEELPHHYSKYNLEIKTNANKSGTQEASEVVTEKGATWLRLYFEEVELGANGKLTITSLLDGATQTLTANTLKEWKNSTAYFNGDKVRVTLTSGAKSGAIRLKVNELEVGEKSSTKTQCGSSDDRRASSDRAIGRIMPIGCTGWIIRNGKLVTAGHCATSRAQLIEFQVPKSNSGGSVVHPGPEDQYPIGNFVTEYTGASTDWAVFTASANSQTGKTPIQAQGKSYNVVQSNPGSTIRITGYGVDTGRDNQTQQTHSGPLSSSTNTFVRYRTDTEGGNSGSPIIDEASGNAVGVHGYGGCSRSGGSNYGVRATVSNFWRAMGLSGGGGCSDGDQVNVTFRNSTNCSLSFYRNGSSQFTISAGQSRQVSTTVGTNWQARNSGQNVDSFTINCNSTTYTASGNCGGSGDICAGVAPWRSGVSYSAGDRVTYRGYLYEKRSGRGWNRIGRCGSRALTESVTEGGVETEAFENQKFTVAPNPVAGGEIEIFLPPTVDASYEIIDLLGKTIQKGSAENTINVSGLKRGVYMIKISSEGKNQIQRIIKK
nr:chitinase [Aquimarina hainanensis]